AERSLTFDLERSAVGCPFHVDVRRFVEDIAHGRWDDAAQVIHEAHPFPQILGMHCHRYCETALMPEGGLTIPRPERLRVPDTLPAIGALEWAAGRYGERPRFHPGEPTGKQVAIIGAGSGGLMCAWVLRKCGHEVHVFD